MSMRHRVSRLFRIETRFEAFLVIYAIAVGAAERARHYLETYPGWGGFLLAFACSGVVFVAGAKLLDAVRPVPKRALAARTLPRRPLRSRLLSRNRRTAPPTGRGAGSHSSLRKD